VDIRRGSISVSDFGDGLDGLDESDLGLDAAPHLELDMIADTRGNGLVPSPEGSLGWLQLYWISLAIGCRPCTDYN
jgi:hypothetical protein